jgi:hypothetical protein
MAVNYFSRGDAINGLYKVAQICYDCYQLYSKLGKSSTQASFAQFALGLIIEQLLPKSNQICKRGDRFIFFEGNGCTQDNLGTMDFGTNANLKKVSCMTNDEIRSMQLVGPVPQGTQIKVCDNPDCIGDDYAILTLKRDLCAWETYCLSSFENGKRSGIQSDDVMMLQVVYVNGLDGKISFVSITDPTSAGFSARLLSFSDIFRFVMIMMSAGLFLM